MTLDIAIHDVTFCEDVSSQSGGLDYSISEFSLLFLVHLYFARHTFVRLPEHLVCD